MVDPAIVTSYLLHEKLDGRQAWMKSYVILDKRTGQEVAYDI